MTSTTLRPIILSGRRFSKKELILVQDTVTMFPHLSRNELALTICEHLSWVTPNKSAKVQSCLKALENLEDKELIQLPKKRIQKTWEHKTVQYSDRTEPGTEIRCSLDQISPLELQIVKGDEKVSLWNEYVGRYHYLGGCPRMDVEGILPFTRLVQIYFQSTPQSLYNVLDRSKNKFTPKK